MDIFISSLVFALIGVAAIKFLRKFLMRQKKNNNNSNIDNMSRNDFYQPYEHSNRYTKVDESRPSTVAIIYRSEMDYISRCIHDYPNIETGGQLFGYLTENGSPVVCYAIGPGRNANHQSAFFNQDTEYLQSIYNELNRRYGLRYIGEWHSHHQLGLAKPSGHDASTIVHGIQRNNFRHFLLCIGNCNNNFHSTLNAFTFHINDQYHYFHAPWKIIETESPYRPIVDRDLQHMLCHPRYPHASYGSNYIISESGKPSMITPNYGDNYWLNDKSNNLVLKQIIDYISSYNGEEHQVKPQLDADKHVHLLVQRFNGFVQITFGERFPEEAPIIIPSVGIPYNMNANWTYNGNIYDTFACYYDEMFRTNDVAQNLGEPLDNQDNHNEQDNQNLRKIITQL